MEEKSLKRISKQILIYDILCVGIGGFFAALGCGLGVGYIYAAGNIFVKAAIFVFGSLIGTWIIGFILLMAGSLSLVKNKDGAKRLSIIGIWFCFALACGTIGLGLIFAMPPPRWNFANSDFIVFFVEGSIILYFAILILNKLKRI